MQSGEVRQQDRAIIGEFADSEHAKAPPGLKRTILVPFYSGGHLFVMLRGLSWHRLNAATHQQ
jgi:hypothetical protein